MTATKTETASLAVNPKNDAGEVRTFRRGRTLVIQALVDAPEQFQEILAIDNIDYATQALGMAALFTGAIDNNTGKFNPSTARTLIDAYNNDLPADQKDYRLAIFNVLQTSVTQTNNVVSGMIDKILQVLKDAVGIALGSTTVAQMTTSITEAFTGLKSQESDAWIFWQKKTGKKTTYSYAILFAIQDRSTGRFMLCLPLSLDIEVDMEFEKVLWITVKDKTSYTVKMDAMKVGQLLFPVAPGSAHIQQALAQSHRTAGSSAEDWNDVQDGIATAISVKNWTGQTIFATATRGQYSKNGPLEQLMTDGATLNPDAMLVLGQSYVVSFTINGGSIVRNLRFNGDVGTPPDPSLWFVSV